MRHLEYHLEYHLEIHLEIHLEFHLEFHLETHLSTIKNAASRLYKKRGCIYLYSLFLDFPLSTISASNVLYMRKFGDASPDGT